LPSYQITPSRRS